MRNYEELLTHANKAMMERLTDPKNVAKGDFPIRLGIIADGIVEEYHEIMMEFDKARRTAVMDKERLRSELSDLMVACSFGIILCDHAKVGEKI